MSKKENQETVENQNENAETQAEETEGVNAEEAAPKTPEERIAELEAEIENMKKEALYKAAENDNWRKRMMQQKEEAVAYANANLLSDLLDSIDNLDRTVEAAKKYESEEVKNIVEGMQMVSKGLVSMLENKYELSGYGAEGDEFDPELHEAIARAEEEGIEKETLKAVYLKGYKLKDRVLRHAKVMVSVPKA